LIDAQVSPPPGGHPRDGGHCDRAGHLGRDCAKPHPRAV